MKKKEKEVISNEKIDILRIIEIILVAAQLIATIYLGFTANEISKQAVKLSEISNTNMENQLPLIYSVSNSDFKIEYSINDKAIGEVAKPKLSILQGSISNAYTIICKNKEIKYVTENTINRDIDIITKDCIITFDWEANVVSSNLTNKMYDYAFVYLEDNYDNIELIMIYIEIDHKNGAYEFSEPKCMNHIEMLQYLNKEDEAMNLMLEDYQYVQQMIKNNDYLN